MLLMPLLMPPLPPRLRVWFVRGLLLAGLGAVFLLLVIVPVAGSFLITNARFTFDRGDTGALPFDVEQVEFVSVDGVRLEGWWSLHPGPSRGTVVLVHGLNRSRVEMLERAARVRGLGFSTLLFDLRNHGTSQEAATTLGVRESGDVCRAAAFARDRDPEAPILLWGVSLGAAAALLGAECSGAVAVVAESSFLSVEDTVRHHFRQILPLPAFPIADLLLAVTRLRMGFARGDGDVEAAVRGRPGMPILFVAGGRDWRMPPDIARRLLRASSSRHSRLVVIEEASHGRAWEQDPGAYFVALVRFLDDVVPDPATDRPTPTLY
jgi:hypothetical protein